MEIILEEVKAYKIVEKHGDKIKTLFHGLNKSRIIPLNTWLEAEEKMVTDGKGTAYLSGWHVLLDYEKAVEYLSRFTTRTELLEVVPVLVKNIRPKRHSNSDVYLAKHMKVVNN